MVGAAGAVGVVSVVCAVDSRQRLISVMDASRARLKSATTIHSGLTAHGLFILQCSNYLLFGALTIYDQGAAGVPCQKYRIAATSAKTARNRRFWRLRTKSKAWSAQ